MKNVMSISIEMERTRKGNEFCVFIFYPACWISCLELNRTGIVVSAISALCRCAEPPRPHVCAVHVFTHMHPCMSACQQIGGFTKHGMLLHN